MNVVREARTHGMNLLEAQGCGLGDERAVWNVAEWLTVQCMSRFNGLYTTLLCIRVCHY